MGKYVDKFGHVSASGATETLLLPSIRLDRGLGRNEIETAQRACLRPGLLLLLLVEGEKGDTGDLDDLETHTGKVTNGVSTTTETGDEHLVVFVDVVEATIPRDESGDLLTVLDELHANTLTIGGVRLCDDVTRFRDVGKSPNRNHRHVRFKTLAPYTGRQAYA
ncbi:formate alpha, putative [Babesia ovata]|uniref:Formate alpha, putative n=1 Tax=Babesia ovata TaxID=189622 RepID=A0A2H6KJ99_9APIC|nr:formate alpha, putative [Babesia ovata]GBE63067.1 formate alpha, putative [Babesia ovata]